VLLVNTCVFVADAEDEIPICKGELSNGKNVERGFVENSIIDSFGSSESIVKILSSEKAMMFSFGK